MWKHTFALPVAVASATAAAAQESIGVVALVNPDAELTRGSQAIVPESGGDIFLDDRLVTRNGGQVHLMLVDKSTFTVGPDSDITIDQFVYDPAESTGEMAISAVRGVMRFVGGDISKNNPVEIQTSIGTLGIRGGIGLISIDEAGGITAVFSFGTALSFTGLGGGTEGLISRPGFQISISPTGVVSGPVPADPNVVNQFLGSFEAGGGQSNQTDTDVPGNSETEPQTFEFTPDFQQVVIDLIQESVAAADGNGAQQIVIEIDDAVIVPVEDVTEQQFIEIVIPTEPEPEDANNGGGEIAPQ